MATRVLLAGQVCIISWYFYTEKQILWTIFLEFSIKLLKNLVKMFFKISAYVIIVLLFSFQKCSIFQLKTTPNRIFNNLWLFTFMRIYVFNLIFLRHCRCRFSHYYFYYLQASGKLPKSEHFC